MNQNKFVETQKTCIKYSSIILSNDSQKPFSISQQNRKQSTTSSTFNKTGKCTNQQEKN